MLTGAGRAFSAGVDLKALAGREIIDGAVGDILDVPARRAIELLTTMPKVDGRERQRVLLHRRARARARLRPDRRRRGRQARRHPREVRAPAHVGHEPAVDPPGGRGPGARAVVHRPHLHRRRGRGLGPGRPGSSARAGSTPRSPTCARPSSPTAQDRSPRTRTSTTSPSTPGSPPASPTRRRPATPSPTPPPESQTSAERRFDVQQRIVRCGIDVQERIGVRGWGGAPR